MGRDPNVSKSFVLDENQVTITLVSPLHCLSFLHEFITFISSLHAWIKEL